MNRQSRSAGPQAAYRPAAEPGREHARDTGRIVPASATALQRHATDAIPSGPPPPPTTQGKQPPLRIDHSPRVEAQRASFARIFAGAVQRESLRGDEDADAGAGPARPNRTGLPDALKAGIEALSGLDMSDVRVHVNSGKPAQLNAAAYAQGHDIHLGPGQEQHLPHEAWHVVQQKLDKVRPNLRLPGGAGVNDDPGLERDATLMGRRAVALGAGSALSHRHPGGTPLLAASTAPGSGAVQRVPHASNFEQSLLDELGDMHTAAPIAGLVAVPIVGAAPAALTGGVNAALDAQFATAIQAARRMDATASPRAAADALHPNAAAATVAVPGAGAVAPLMEMADIRTFLLAISNGGLAGIGAGRTPAGHDRSVIEWGSMHQEFGTFVQARLRLGGGQNGSSPSTAGTSGIGGGNWALLHRRKKTPGVTLYARGHLLHGEMGGPGLDYNLVPLTNGPAHGANSANLAMAQYVEHTVKTAFFNMWGPGPTVSAVNYDITAFYTGHQRPMTTRVDHIATAYANTNTALQVMPAPLGFGGNVPTHAQVMAAEAIAVAAFVPPCPYPGNLPGGAFPAFSTINNHAIVMAGTGAAQALPSVPAMTVATDALDAAATPHVHSAMAAMAALNHAATDADDCEANLRDNADLWAEEDNIVPTHVQMIYNWVENGAATPVRQPTIEVALPNSAAALFE